jgi:DNA adenine methylase
MSFHHEALFNPKKTTFADARHRSGGHSKAHEWMTYPRQLVNVCLRLRGVIIENRDALEIIRVQDTPNTLFFVDPPYLPSTRSSAGYRCELTEHQHIELLQQLLSIKGRAIVAGYPSELYDDMLADWRRLERPHRAAGSKRVRTEVLWISP